ncbi:MAG: homoserine kinase [Gammaproteobacteria bacterium]|nr:homoserine kinase [Gammaproteobacteria bacterium]
MSVFTRVERTQLEAFIATYDLGELIEFAGISDGIVNTNYFVTTTAGRYVLTLFEELKPDELPYFIALMRFAHEHSVPCALPAVDRNGEYLRELCGKPALLVVRLSGGGVARPNTVQCQQIGSALGALHRVGVKFSRHRETEHGSAWHAQTAAKVLTVISGADAALLSAEMDFQGAQEYSELPVGLTHGDLFRDNALFDGDTLSGIIDFYYACDYILVHDLAVVVNDWCGCEDGSLDMRRVEALMQAYQLERPLDEKELAHWSAMLRAAALRYWLSRLFDLHFPRPGEMTHAKDPNYFRQILEQRVALS